MRCDLHYDGQTLHWAGKGRFAATSGMSGYQHPRHQCLAERGPVPAGTYAVFIAERGVAADDGRGVCALKPAWGLQTIPRGAAAGSCESYWANWGLHRARLEPADSPTRVACSPARGGFWLHDSIKGYSHGCIEVSSALFAALRAHYRKTGTEQLLLRVAYVPERETNGGTAR